MRKLGLITASLLLSSAWVVAQSTPPTDSHTQQYPSSTSPSSQQPSEQDQTQASAHSDKVGHSIEGCIGGSAGAFTLTDASGKSYQLAGETSKLSDHVGHTVALTGHEEPSTAGAASTGAPATFTVTKVKMLSASCTGK